MMPGQGINQAGQLPITLSPRVQLPGAQYYHITSRANGQRAVIAMSRLSDKRLVFPAIGAACISLRISLRDSHELIARLDDNVAMV
jgi:hypothetical protein